MNLFEKAIQYFGTTSDFRETGYILPNGIMLDFSGKRYGGPKGIRTMDHREVATIIDLPQTEAMIAFMSAGCIRVAPEGPGLDIAARPTAAQIDVIRRFSNYYRGAVYVDISDEKGNIVASFEYAEKTSSSRIVSDILLAFQTAKQSA